MTYIHERSAWPSFTWDQTALQQTLAALRNRQGRLLGRMESLGFDIQADAMLQTLSDDVVQSSAIEGEQLPPASVRSSVARHLGLEPATAEPDDSRVEGIVAVLFDATHYAQMALTQARLQLWHRTLFPTGHKPLHPITLGAWRTDARGPMQVISGPIGRERVHFEAPAAARLPHEMRRFLRWFNADDGQNPILRAALAHLWFVTIHPFDDGNGRIARALADMCLTRGENGTQRFYSMSSQISAERRDYYAILEATQRGTLDITPWMAWFLACLSRALDRSDTALAQVLARAEFWRTHAQESFNPRQRLMLTRLLDSWEGKLTSSKWAMICKCSQDTASRDIDDLLRRGILHHDGGGGRSTGYVVAA